MARVVRTVRRAMTQSQACGLELAVVATAADQAGPLAAGPPYPVVNSLAWTGTRLFAILCRPLKHPPPPAGGPSQQTEPMRNPYKRLAVERTEDRSLPSVLLQAGEYHSVAHVGAERPDDRSGRNVRPADGAPDRFAAGSGELEREPPGHFHHDPDAAGDRPGLTDDDNRLAGPPSGESPGPSGTRPGPL